MIERRDKPDTEACQNNSKRRGGEVCHHALPIIDRLARNCGILFGAGDVRLRSARRTFGARVELNHAMFTIHRVGLFGRCHQCLGVSSMIPSRIRLATIQNKARACNGGILDVEQLIDRDSSWNSAAAKIV
jgi:hypothetical protein